MSAAYTAEPGDDSKWHKWHDVIVAWAQGAEIEYFNLSHPGEGWKYWHDDGQCTPPFYAPNLKWRVKPQPKPNVTIEQRWRDTAGTYRRVAHVYSGETGELLETKLLPEA